MKLLRFPIFVCFISLFSICHSQAQSDFSVSIIGGPIYYNGDLSDSRLIPPTKLMSIHYGLEGTAMLTDRVEMGLSFLKGTLKGDDALSNDKYKRLRNLSFNTDLMEFALKMRLEFFKTVDFRPVNTALILGAGFIRFNPTAEINGDEVDLQPLGTEGQFINEPSYPAPYKLSSTVIMAGIGARITLNSRMALLLDLTPRITFTDYLDDVSGVYPDSASLAASPGGATAVQASYQGLNTSFPARGRGRGNAENNDIYVVGGISFRYYFGEPYHSGSKPGIFRRIKNAKGGWWGDRH
ncbi:MAG: DUF6089 family protein [Bacteroidota bacterium]